MTVDRTLAGRRLLLVVAGGIAAYKCLDLIRRVRERGGGVRTVLTGAGANFVTPLSLSALTEDKVYQDLFSLTDEAEMGHIRLTREADLVVVAPATANLLAKMATGICDDLASTAILASNKPILCAPAMNHCMWKHPATQANVATLRHRGVRFVGPNDGDMACGEHGPGRMAEPAEILDAIGAAFAEQDQAHRKPLKGRRVLVTSGPTREPIDPVRYISNHSSGRQGHAIAAALARLGAETILVSGPVSIPDPDGCRVVRIETAAEMLEACQAALPLDAAICAAAVADWRVKTTATQKIKKGAEGPPMLEMEENPDILATLAQLPPSRRPRLVIGFAAETEQVVDHAKAKLTRKRCDWILANDVSPASGTFGGDENTVHLVRTDRIDTWPRLAKTEVGTRLATAVADHFHPMGA